MIIKIDHGPSVQNKSEWTARQRGRAAGRLGPAVSLPAHAEIGLEWVTRRFVLLALILLLTVGTGYPTVLVRQEKISVSRALAGHVLIRGTGEPASGVTVDICSSDWKTVLTSTKTDENGHFSLERPATVKLFYIRVSAPGMDIYELRVRIDKHATQELTIHLSVAT